MKSPSFVSENYIFPGVLGASAIILSTFRHGADGALAMAAIIALTTEDDFDAVMARAAWELRGPSQGQPLMATM